MEELKNKRLSWKIEAFREYLCFEVLQPAASVMKLFEGHHSSGNTTKMKKMQKLLEERTNKSSWIPKRSGSADLNWNVEGDVWRNKGRLFSSMLIMYPREWYQNRIKLTEFGSALASGIVKKSGYYDFLLKNYCYPHPAYKEHYEEWINHKEFLLPFIYLLKALLLLYEENSSASFLTTDEIADYLHLNPSHRNLPQKVNKILESRTNITKKVSKRTDDIHHKINDLMGFLCLSGYCHYQRNNIVLSTISEHSLERVYFDGERKKESMLNRVKCLVKDAEQKYGI